MRVLTKSRFKLGLECPNKLYFTGKDQFENLKLDDPFMKALANGGFQVEEYARLHYPNGALIEGVRDTYENLHKITQELLKQENVVIYEAAFLFDGLFIRTDILVKEGNRIKLIEVKAKSCEGIGTEQFFGKRGGMEADWKPYLFDLAFQTFVVRNCHPEFNVIPYLMLADKSKFATVDGMNQFFRIRNSEETRTGIQKRVETLSQCGESVLSEVQMDEVVNRILKGTLEYSKGRNFTDSLNLLKDVYAKDEFANTAVSFSKCKKCEFKTVGDNCAKLSGLEFCFRSQKKWAEVDLNRPNTFEIWNFKKGGPLLEMGKFYLEDLIEEDVVSDPVQGKMAPSERQWIQIEKSRSGDQSIFVDEINLRNEMNSWKFPLHFIDFETSTVALPFTEGRRPYEQVAFQFSHHQMEADGTVSHVGQTIIDGAGVFPNFEFVRKLKSELSKDDGTIFRYSNHENTILVSIYFQLQASSESDRVELCEFIQSITQLKEKKSVFIWKGARNMVDLCQVVKDYYYNPLMKGSNSIKAVLPAILGTSAFLQNKYAKSISKIGLSSLNFPSTHVWLSVQDGVVESPYDRLPKLFENWDYYQRKELLSEIEEVSNGGAAMMVYSKLQYEDMTVSERTELVKGLLKYCELDTLAMVMLFEELRELVL